MFCTKCGVKMKEGAKFCPDCGTPVVGEKAVKEKQFPPLQTMQDSGQEQEDKRNFSSKKEKKKPANKRRKGKRIAILILVVIIAAGIGGAAFYWKSEVRLVKANIDKGNYKQALAGYNAGVSQSFIQKKIGDLIIPGEIEDIAEKYQDGSLKYKEAQEALSVLTGLKDDKLSSLSAEQLGLLEKIHTAKDIYEKAENLYKEEKYADAIKQYEMIEETMPYFDDAQSRLEECRSTYKKDVLKQTESPVDESSYRSCLTMISVAIDTLGEDPELVEREKSLTENYQKLVKENALTGANTAVGEQDYEKAISVLDQALSILKDDAELSSMMTSTQGAYEESIAAKVSELVGNENYDEATKILENAMKILPGSETIASLYEDVVGATPVRLCELKMAESDNVALIEEQIVTEDTVGNVYDPGNLYEFGGNWSVAYAKFYLGGKYQKLRFTQAVSSVNESHTNPKTLTVYGNENKILYTSGELTRATAPKEIEVDVSGQDWLYFSADTPNVGYRVTLLVADPVLYP